MALSLETSNQAWMRIDSNLANASPASKWAFRDFKKWMATQKGNNFLRVVPYVGTSTGLLAGQSLAISESCRLMAVWGVKPNTETDTYLVGYDAVASSGGGSGPSLGAAQGFAILGATTVTNTGSSVIVGDLGLSPGTSVTGFPPGTVTGTQHITDSQAAAAQVSLTSALAAVAALASTETLAPGVVIGSGGTRPSFTAGVYDWATAGQLTGAVTLTGSATDVFVFRMGSTLTTASASSVILAGGAIAANVFWRVGSSATLGTTTALIGNVLAVTSITANTSATVNGRLLASTGAVTLDTNAVSIAQAGGSGASVSADGRFSLPFLESNRESFMMFPSGIPFVTNILLKAYTTFDGVTNAGIVNPSSGFVLLAGPALQG